jgi:hypothetical protein
VRGNLAREIPMSMIAYYVRLDSAAVDELTGHPDSIFDKDRLPTGAETIDIDLAWDALAWLASETKRAEVSHNGRLMRDNEWRGDEVRASVARLDAMPIDDALAAIEGRAERRIEGIDFGLGGAAYFAPERVSELSAALAELTDERLREQVDFETMERDMVQPDYWTEEGEDLFRTYVLPARDRLQRFYADAAAADQAVLVVWS